LKGYLPEGQVSFDIRFFLVSGNRIFPVNCLAEKLIKFIFNQLDIQYSCAIFIMEYKSFI